MYVPPSMLLRSLLEELAAHFADDKSEASVGQSATAAIRLLEVRERGGAKLMDDRVDAVAALLPKLEGHPALAGAAALQDVRAKLAEAQRVRDSASFIALAESLEAAVADTARADVPAEARLSLARLLAEWEVVDRRRLTDAQTGGGAGEDVRVTAEKFEAYLRDRFNEPDLSVTDFRPLSGGFGKQTILVSVSGRAIDGPLVIRRDPSVPTVDNDSHRVRNEYPIMRAAFERGFPAPEALWLDTEHRLLPGPDFLVMRMSPGKTGGNVFRSSEALSPELIDVLASGAAHLHSLPPLVELGDLTDSIRADRWDLPVGEVTRRYIEGWFDLYRANAHNPSPTLMALYGWTLDNIPDAPGRPVLVHGDIGFHNMLIDNGRLTALVDWEFAHIGDAAEDMGSIRNVLGEDGWDDVMARYRAAGGPEIDPVRLHFFRVWQHVRNASASNLSMGKFQTGEIPDLKLAYTGHYHFPLFIKAAWDLIEAGPEGAEPTVDY